jgi:hypothetical protein
MSGMRLRWAISALAALALALPASAGAVTFGADLSVAPNSDLTCEQNPGAPFLHSGADTCTWWTTGRINDTSQGHVVPYGGGTITRARVRVGPVTGPMQFVVLRSLRHPQSLADPACCFPVGASGVFTPAPNGVTTVPMNVPVRHDTDPASGINNYDHIAISVLAPGVPIPAFYTGDQSLAAPVGGGFYPAYVPGTERTTGLFGVVGFQTLINADLDPTSPGTGTPTGPVDLGKRATVRGGRALVPLTCNLPRSCVGLLRLRQPAGAGAGASASKRRRAKATYGKSRFKVPAGKRKLVKVKLTGAGKRLMRKRARARVLALVKLSSKQKTSGVLTLRRGPNP